VLATAKIHILKQFTTSKRRIDKIRYCACYCKDTHFEAIHNEDQRGDAEGVIVLATAKIHILKQFTTIRPILATRQEIVLATAKIHILKQFTTKGVKMIISDQLCLLLQRYTF